MKELSIKEKAERYDKALQRTRKWYDANTNEGYRSIFKDIFPELKESEDERIRKRLMEWVEEFRKLNPTNADYNAECSEALSWLEKQGEHANFISKIQVGDKVTHNEDGVLVNLSQLNRVAKKELKKIEQNPAGKKTTLYDNMDDLIADAMIDDIKNADMPEHCKHNRLTWINKHRSKPAEWSDKDEAMITLLHNIIDHHYSMDIIKKEEQLKLEDWLKFLKDRVLPKPAEWSEEDENHVKSILSTIECCKAQFPNAQAVVEAYNADIEWLNSLRPQSTWKPSNEQMKALYDSIPENVFEISEREQLLESLYRDLEKL